MGNFSYITRNTPEAKLTGSATCRLPNARGIKVTPTWEGYYGIHGTVDYTYDKIETYTDENGNTKINLVEMRGSDSFDFSPNVSFITDKEANRPG